MEFRPVFSSRDKGDGRGIARDVGMARDARQFPGNRFRRQNVIDVAGGNGAAGHAVIFGAGFLLSEGDAALSLNFGQSERAIGSGAGEDHADGAIALARQGTHE